MRRRFALLITTLLIGTACGSTAPRGSESNAQASTTSGGLSLAPGTTTTTGGSGAGTTGLGSGTTGLGGGTTTSGGTVSGGGTTGESGGTGSGSGGGGTTNVAPSVPGVTSTTIYIGTFWTKNQGSANAALGANLNEGDRRKAWQIVIDQINKEGGLAGRKLVQIPYGYDANSQQTQDQQDQAACAEWTQDHKVFAIEASSSIIDECAKKAGAVEPTVGGTALPETYSKFPDRIDIDSLNMVREGGITIDGLFKHGYFDKGMKLGFVTWDDPFYKEALNRGYLPELKRHGLSLAAPPAYLHSPQTAQEIGQTSADAASYILKFKSQGIDHVIILDGPSGACGGACIMLEWMRQAQSQDYHPRYGLNDSDGPPSAALEAGLVPADQLHRSISVGWIDYEKATSAGLPPNKGRQRCEAMMRKGGYDISNLNALGAALTACDQLWFLQQAFGRMSGSVSAASFIGAVNSLGYSFSSVQTYGNFFSASRHDGLGEVRIAIFNDSCSCYKYPQKPYRV